jgi:hypothetical protein
MILLQSILELSARLLGGAILHVAGSDTETAGKYWSVEGMDTYEFSVGAFFLMVCGVVVFAAIIFRFFWSSGMGKNLKRGEKLLFAWIIAGTAVAVGFGTLQLLYGRLF